uniref:Gag-Pol polyprotein n=1 Tax=Tanacetum cinerariifolium TaxID=118510 RepID=A0A6L2NBX3_TANCI|nr:hypothetical protein [Tanacetum cinerariifolium]
MSTQQDIYAAGSENHPPMLNKDNYIPWSSRIIRYARSRPNGKMIVDSIKNEPYVRLMIATPGEPDLPVPVPESFHEQTDEELTENDIKRMDADDQAIQTILLGLPEDEKKAKLFNEWENFTSTDGESFESYYHRFMQLMNDLKRNKHFPENIATNLKFFNNLQPEWKRHVTIVRQTKNLHEADFTQIYDFLKMNQDENQQGYNAWQNGGIQVAQNAVQNAGVQSGGHQNGLVVVPGITNQNGIGNVIVARAEGTGNGNQARCYNCRGLEEFDFMAAAGDLDEIEEVNANCILMANLQHASTSGTQLDKAPVYDTDGSAEYTELLEPIPEPQLVPQNDNHVTHVAPSMVQSGGTVETSYAPNEETRAHQETVYRNLVDQVAQVNMVNCNMRATNGELKSELARYKIQEQRVEISQEKYDKLKKCYQKSVYQEQCLTRKINALHLSSAKQIMTLNDEISNLNKQLSKEKSSISSLMEEKKKLKHDFKTQEDKFLDKEVNLEAKIKDLENIMLKRDQTKAQLKQQSLYNGNFLLEEHDPPAMYDSEETLELAQEIRVFVPQTTKSKEELFLSNVSNMVTVSKMISLPNEDLSDDTTPSVARKFLNEVKSSLVTLQRVVKQKITLKVHNWSSSAHKEVHKIISHEIAPIINQADVRVQNFKIQFLQEVAKFVRDFKSLTKEAHESLDKQKSLELEIERLLKESVIHDIIKEKEYAVLWNNWYTKCEECKYDKISYDKAYNDMQQKVERLQAQLRDLKVKSSDTPSASNTLDPLNQKLESKIVELEFQVVNYEREISHLKTTYKNLFNFITSNRAHAKLHNHFYENAQLRARVFKNTSESMNNTSGTSVTPHVDKPKLSVVTSHSKKLHASITSHSVPQPREFNVVKHRNVIALGMFKINPSQNYRVDLVPNKKSSAIIRTNPITNSQRHVTFKENVSSGTVTASSTGLVHTAKTRGPLPKGNIRNARVPSASKSSEVKKNVTVEDHRRTLLLFKN